MYSEGITTVHFGAPGFKPPSPCICTVGKFVCMYVSETYVCIVAVGQCAFVGSVLSVCQSEPFGPALLLVTCYLLLVT